jgi:hypothetical protein
MGKGKIVVEQYRHLSSDERAAFRRWLMANAVVGSILAIGIVAMAVAGYRSGPPPEIELAGIEKASSVGSWDKPQ